MIADSFIISWRNLKKRKTRSILTMIGIIISVATIFVLISLSVGLQGAVEEQFRLLGSDKFFVQPLGQFGPPGTEAGAKLSEEDSQVLEKVRGVKKVTYFVSTNGELEFKGEKRYKVVSGVPLESFDLYVETGTIKADEGRLLENGDNDVIMLGSYFRDNNIFSSPVHAGNKISINGKDFKVKAIAAPIGNPGDDQNIYMPLDNFRSLFNISERVDAIVVQIEKGENINDVTDRANKQLMKFRDVTEKTKDFSILTPEELLASFGSILNIITGFLIAVAGISLIVGAVGIANTMYTSVLERTKEIGVMKAIGAQNKDILMIFLIEAGLLGLVGGIIGVLFGFGISKTIEFIVVNVLGTNLLRAAAPVYLIVGCLAFAILTGIVAGTLPAWRASKTNVVDAIRYE